VFLVFFRGFCMSDFGSDSSVCVHDGLCVVFWMFCDVGVGCVFWRIVAGDVLGSMVVMVFGVTLKCWVCKFGLWSALVVL